MIYREAGQFRTTYVADQRIFPITQDRVAMAMLLIVAFVVVPAAASNYVLTALLLPMLVLAIAALGLNILTGYAGQFSLGTAAFMSVGAFAAYNFQLRVPGIPLLVTFVLAGLVAAGVGLVFGLPSLRIKGFYLAVATLAAQFFVDWLFTKVAWFSNDSPSGTITAQPMVIAGLPIDSPARRYLLVLSIAAVLALAAKNLSRTATGRAWMAVRDMDVAAEVIGIPILRTKLVAFGISSFYCGVSGALMVFLWYGGAESTVFNINQSFTILFMIIIGGLGSLLGSFLGAALIYILPIILRFVPPELGIPLHAATVEHLTFMITGALIVLFLIAEPAGLSRLWQIGKQKLRVWPFPY